MGFWVGLVSGYGFLEFYGGGGGLGFGFRDFDVDYWFRGYFFSIFIVNSGWGW